jgi:hypothetical protein
MSSLDPAESLPAADSKHVDAFPVEGTQATGRWTLEEDIKLTSAVANTCKKKYCKDEY